MKKIMLKKGDKGHLSDLKIGQRAKVLGLHMDKPELRRHLLDMGITKGTKILIKKVAPMGDPIDIKIRGYELALEKPNKNRLKWR